MLGKAHEGLWGAAAVMKSLFGAWKGSSGQGLCLGNAPWCRNTAEQGEERVRPAENGGGMLAALPVGRRRPGLRTGTSSQANICP